MSVTFEEQRTEQEKQIDADVLARVKRGLAWLEETHGRGWEDKIDLATLDLTDSSRCVLGQVYAGSVEEGELGYTYACYALGDASLREWEDRQGRGFTTDLWQTEGPLLQEAWEFVLRPRVTGQP